MNLPITTSAKKLRESLLERHNAKFEKLLTQPIYIFCAQSLGAQCLQSCLQLNLSVLGFIDSDPKKQGTQYCGLPIYSLEEIDRTKDPLIIIASIIHHFEVEKILIQKNFTSFIEYHLLPFYNDLFPQHPIYQGIFEDIEQNKEHILFFKELLLDQNSRDVFDNLLKYKMTFNSEHLQQAQLKSTSIQYFDPSYCSFTTEDSFVDGGGYDGQTTKEFIKLANGKYKKIYYFEPDSENFKESKKNLASFENIDFFQKGLYSHSETLFFSNDHTEGSKLQDSGTLTIQTTSLDECIKEPISFIKFDIEGAEYSALLGAKEHIQEDHPMLAICIYHSPEDFWRIPLLIKNILEESTDIPSTTYYDFYLKHHSLSGLETVFYAIPKKATLANKEMS